jgi:hypothetical protein
MTQNSLDTERDELLAIAGMMESTVPGLRPRLEAWREHLTQGLDGAAPLEHEHMLERATMALRHVWLAAAASSTSKSYRSPAKGERTITPAGRFHNFGYERDLQPTGLEARCAKFFPPPPPGWSAEHVLFSSGQAAMNALLTLLGTGQERRQRLRHDGCYFETAELLGLYASRFEIGAHGPADLVIAEPLWNDGKSFGATSLAKLGVRANQDRTAGIIVDSTLSGLDDGLNDLLAALENGTQVFRLHSGLKLFQAGLELADVGIVSLYGSQGADTLRHIRTLQGTGLSFADVAALELPLFLNADATRAYETAILLHNAALADAARGNSALPTVYPSGPRPAPFVVFDLKSAANYDTLDDRIAAEAARRGLAFIKGGSFGFRGHRFETVRPEGKPPFLRVAMGKRAGPSLEGILELFRAFAPSAGRAPR